MLQPLNLFNKQAETNEPKRRRQLLGLQSNKPMSNCHVSCHFVTVSQKIRKPTLGLIIMVIKLGVRALLLLLFEPATPNSPLRDVSLHLSTISGKKVLLQFRQDMAVILSLTGGWRRSRGIPSSDTGWGEISNQSLFLPRTVEEQETSDLSLLRFTRCCSPTGK